MPGKTSTPPPSAPACPIRPSSSEPMETGLPAPPRATGLPGRNPPWRLAAGQVAVLCLRGLARLPPAALIGVLEPLLPLYRILRPNHCRRLRRLFAALPPERAPD